MNTIIAKLEHTNADLINTVVFCFGLRAIARSEEHAFKRWLLAHGCRYRDLPFLTLPGQAGQNQGNHGPRISCLQNTKNRLFHAMSWLT